MTKAFFKRLGLLRLEPAPEGGSLSGYAGPGGLVFHSGRFGPFTSMAIRLTYCCSSDIPGDLLISLPTFATLQSVDSFSSFTV
jgi:hypothetical protein